MNAALFPDLIVNGELVPHTLVANETQNHEAPKGKPGIAWRKAINAITVRTLLLQEARIRGVTPVPQEVGPGRFETDEAALIRGLLEEAIDAARPEDSEIKAEWCKDPTRFRTPPLWEVSHILCVCDPRDEVRRRQAFERAKKIGLAVNKDPKSFPAVAARESDCGSKSSGGALGQVGPGDTVPEFESVLRELKEGAITPDPVLTRHGYHLIRMDALAVGQVLPFEAVRNSISQALEKADWARQAKAFVNQLIGAAEIEGGDLKPV